MGEAERLFHCIDVDGRGRIAYSEFVAASLSREELDDLETFLISMLSRLDAEESDATLRKLRRIFEATAAEVAGDCSDEDDESTSPAESFHEDQTTSFTSSL